MDSALFIPEKIKVGFQKRTDTYTGNLAYVIYYDQKGVLRKEISWQSWRDKKIEPQDFDNTPIEGFVINRSIERYNWGHFSSNRSYIRVHDPRGFEFEISPENLIGLLMNTDCLRKGFVGEFVYAWHGTELILLPTKAEEYKLSRIYSENLKKKILVKDLITGACYKTKRKTGESVVFLGRFEWTDHPTYTGKFKTEKRLIFSSTDGKMIRPERSADFLAEKVQDLVVNYADLVSKFKKMINSSRIKGFHVKPREISKDDFKKEKYYSDWLWKKFYREDSGYIIGENFKPSVNGGFAERHFGNQKTLLNLKTLQKTYSERGKYDYRVTTESISYGTLLQSGFGDLCIDLEDGRSLKYEL